MNFCRNIYLLLLIFGLSFTKISAHEGEDHGAKKPAQTGVSALSHFTAFAVSDKFEVVVYYDPIEAGKETNMTLFLSDFATNAPVNNAKIDISIANDASKKFTVTQTDSGKYNVKGIFPANNNYNLNASISAGNKADLLQIKNIEVGKELPVAAENVTEETPKNSKEISPIWYGLGGLVLGGIIIWLLMAKRRKSVN